MIEKILHLFFIQHVKIQQSQLQHNPKREAVHRLILAGTINQYGKEKQ
jgi:hypothetical protein